MKETKWKYTLRLFHYWCGRLKVPYPVETYRDNRMDTHLAVYDWHTGTIKLIYNTKRMSYKPKYILICDIFHEIGHIKNNLPYKTIEQQVYSERQAERFAIECMKKHYKKQYKVMCKYLITKGTLENLRLKDPIYYEAYKTIKEYTPL